MLPVAASRAVAAFAQATHHYRRVAEECDILLRLLYFASKRPSRNLKHFGTYEGLPSEWYQIAVQVIMTLGSTQVNGEG